MTEYSADWARLAIVKGQPRSVSQAQQYLEDLGGCPYRYFLARIIRAWDRPAAWLPQGIAVHEAAEWWEKGKRTGTLDQMLAEYQKSYRLHTERLLGDTPNPNHWFASGRYEGQEDITRRAALGAEQVRRYYDYYVNQHPGEVVWITPSGEPAIELGFSVYFGKVLVRGFIDQIIDEMTGHPEQFEGKLRDIKTGVSPGGIFQLSVYRYATLKEYDVDILTGDYWMGREGGPTKAYDLTVMTEDQVTDVFGRMDAGVKAEDFTPSPSEKNCGRCGVATACQYAIGEA